MATPDEKPKPSGPMKPPHPPPKKPGMLPKGPVPPRGGMQMPGMTPIQPAAAKPPMMGGAKPAVPGMPPAGAKPPMAPPAMAPRPANAAPPPVIGGMPPPAAPPMMPPAGGSGMLPPAINAKLKEADSARGDMEARVVELEKKLAEEREKVLLASLRSKEEEAVSAKVETSIKEIQDKLRRERREQELDETKRKAEARALDLERRMAEEREAWVSTLKAQLSQRDQATQEMEGHFSTRLKDLEYRWAQEKSALENGIRDKEAELGRLRHETQLKNEQEKAFWEDRVKSITNERDKLERELERSKDKLNQERDQLTLERQTLRDQVSRAENALKFAEDHLRAEKSVMIRENEASLSLVRQQSIIEKDSFEKQTAALTGQMQGQLRELGEKTVRLSTAEQELVSLRAAMTQKELLLQEFRQRASQVGGLTEAERKQYESEIKDLSSQLTHARASHHEEVQRMQTENDTRLKTLQARLDWYDSNIRREYDNAREKVQRDVDDMESRMKAAEKIVSDLKLTAELKGKDALEAEHQWEESEKARTALQRELDQVRADWKQAQWDLETQVKEVGESTRGVQRKLEEAEEARLGLEQELRQRAANAEFEQAQMAKRQAEINTLAQTVESLKKELDLESNKRQAMESQVESYKAMLQGKGIQDVNELARELKKTQDALQQMKMAAMEADKRDDLAHDRERELKQAIAERDGAAADLKNRSATADRKLEMLREEYDQFRTEMKKQQDEFKKQQEQAQQDLLAAKKKQSDDMAAIAKRQADELAALSAAHQQNLQQVKRATVEEVQARMQSQMPPPGPSVDAIESQVRQDLENEYAERAREKESDWENRVAEAKEESKKEIDKLKWDVENMKEELKRAREGRVHIEREAQELLQQAEEHYQNELQKKMGEVEQEQKKPKGLFSTIGLSLGRFLDTPLVDTQKKKDDAIQSPFKE